MVKELDISFIHFQDGWTGVRVMYKPGAFLGMMEVHSWNETRRFGIDFGKGIAFNGDSPVDFDELKDAIHNKINPLLEK